jgi:hypothetical protein
LWSTSYKQGVAQVQQSGDKKEAFFIVEGFPELPETMREVGCGYIQGLLAFTKISNIHVDRDNANPNAWKWKVTWD